MRKTVQTTKNYEITTNDAQRNRDVLLTKGPFSTQLNALNHEDQRKKNTR